MRLVDQVLNGGSTGALPKGAVAGARRGVCLRTRVRREVVARLRDMRAFIVGACASSLLAASVFGASAIASGAFATAAAQSVSIDGPGGSTLPSITPAFTVRALNMGAARPLTMTVQIATSPDFSSGVLVDTTLTSVDSVRTVQTTTPLPGDAVVYWRARVSTPSGLTVSSPIVGPRTVPTWLALLAPNSPSGDVFDLRRPLFVWRSAAVTPAAGPWTYEIEITTQGRTVQGATVIGDTTWRAIADLQTNAFYRWTVKATLPSGGSKSVQSLSTFSVRDPALPARTLLYQNFPNPFPSPVAFATCIWFDVAEPGARVSLDVTDLRGNVIRTLIPGADGQRDFLPGRYGQGLPDTGTNCDNRFVWDGTGSDGRTVAAGVYLLRFQAGRNAPTFRRMMFLGR